jgi:predicted MPP superfamily phosphohydrolase
MSQLHILHISDLHYDDASKTKHIQVSEKLIEDIKRIESASAIRPDIVLFSGDLVNRGSDGRDAYRAVSTIYVEPLLSALGLTQEHFFCVPGNHDVDRDQCFKEFENGLKGELIDSDSLNRYYQDCLKHPHRYDPLRPKLAAYNEFDKSYDGISLCHKDDYLCTDKFEIRGIKIGIARLNSAWRSSGFDTDQCRLLIGSEVLDKAVSLLDDVDLRIAMAHHPLGWLAEWNEREVQNRLAKNFNLFFCGHLHNSNAILFRQILGGGRFQFVSE